MSMEMEGLSLQFHDGWTVLDPLSMIRRDPPV